MGVRDEKAYLKAAERNRRANDAVHDHTRQREFERSFESRDLPGSRASIADACDRGWEVARTVGQIDADFHKRNREAIIRAAAARLPRRPAILQRLLWAVYRNINNRAETIAELGIDRTTYWRGLRFLLKFFSSR